MCCCIGCRSDNSPRPRLQGLALSTFQVVLVPTIIGVSCNELFPGVVKKITRVLPLIGVVLTTLLCASPVGQVSGVLKCAISIDFPKVTALCRRFRVDPAAGLMTTPARSLFGGIAELVEDLQSLALIASTGCQEKCLPSSNLGHCTSCRTMGAQLALPVALLHAFAFGLGYWMCRFLGFNEKTARTVSIETGMLLSVKRSWPLCLGCPAAERPPSSAVPRLRVLPLENSGVSSSSPLTTVGGATEMRQKPSSALQACRVQRWASCWRRPTLPTPWWRFPPPCLSSSWQVSCSHDWMSECAASLP